MEWTFIDRCRSRKDGEGDVSRGTEAFCIGSSYAEIESVSGETREILNVEVELIRTSCFQDRRGPSWDDHPTMAKIVTELSG